MADIAQSQMQDAVYTALDVLQQLGIELPKEPTQTDISLGLDKTKLTLGNKTIAQLIDLPNMSNPNALAAMQILSSTISAAYIGAPQLMPLLVLESVNLSVRYGNTTLSAVAYAWYGMILCGVVIDIETGYQFGQLAVQLLERLNANDSKAQTLFTNSTFISHWREPVRNIMPSQLEAYQTGLETGDVEYASWAAVMHSYNQYWVGEHLSDMEGKIRSLMVAIARFNQKNASVYLQIVHQATLNLLDHTKDPSTLSGESYQVVEAIPLHHATNDRTGLFFSYLCQQYLHYLFEEYAEAVEKANTAKLYFDSCISTLPTVIHCFYDSLARLAVYPKVSSSEHQELLKQVKENQKKLKQWAFHSPSNHQHKFLLVEAERYRILKKYLPAINLYDHAIALAKENQYLNEEALANELAAKLYLDWGKEKIAQVYMIEAYYCYTRWGAKAKVVDLETRYPQLLATILQKQQPSFKLTETMISISSHTIQSSTVSSASLCEALDLATILKVSQSLSSEIELDKLLSTLLEVILESAGADKCALLMPKGSRWVIEALSQLEQPSIILRRLPFDDGQTVPVTLINRVKNTLTLTVIENAVVEPTLAADPYIIRHSPKSILCAPILNQGKLIGILYLENNLTVGAFTSDRLQVLKLLTTQAAISLENAQLYRQLEEYSHTLEQKVEERTQEITHSYTQLESTLEKLYSTQAKLIQAEKMSGLGQLVAGIAHEINNPINFIYGNLQPASQYVASLIELNNLYQQLYPQPLPEIAEKITDIDLEFISDDLQKLLLSMRVGADRIRQIVLSLRNFSRLDESEIKSVDIHSGIDSTLLILQHRLKNNSKYSEITVIREYANLPLVNCYASALNQVFIHLINNAIDALQESKVNRTPTIRIRTEFSESQKVLIRIADNGVGMSESVQNKMFNPFFTTKPIGSATGLGLSTSYSIVVEKHGGELNCISKLGEGTEFFIEIPV
ncbi:MAG: ATP-binding protein [Nostoc sp.]|uniref:trifunctional serine/threonine-protein kinase/ATP-binding protein/sensor histidine kinase n=1 Tax=Nostoc sp. TaxID=1180 RepID=UPI002FF096DB